MSEVILQEARMPAPAGLSKAQKAAIILCLLDRDGAAPLFEELGETTIKHFVRVMAEIGHVGSHTVKAVVAEFLTDLEQRGETVQCGAKAALEIVENNLGRAAAARISESVDLFSGTNVWKHVAAMKPELVADFLTREHPQSAAVVLSKLSPEYAGRVLSAIAPGEARQIARYMRVMKGLGARSTEIIGEALGGFLVSSRQNASARTPAERMGAIMNYASTPVRDDLIGLLEEIDPEFAQGVRRSMFTFADIEKRVARGDVSKVVRAVDSEVLVKALASPEGAVQGAKAYILANIAQRMAAILSEEIGNAAAVKRKDSEKAQAEVIKAIVALEAAGEIELVKEGDEE